MNTKILNLFNPDSEDFDVYKAFEFIEALQDGKLELLDYVDEFIHLLNHVYLEDGTDSELELFMESVNPEILVSKVLQTFDNMDKIETVFDWNKFLFDTNYMPHTLINLKKIQNKDVLRTYMSESIKELSHLSHLTVVKERINNIKEGMECL